MRLPFTTQDVAAALLGEDLWFAPLREYRAYLQTVEQRPHLWTFTFEESGRWRNAQWQRLSLSARVARARLGSLVRTCEFVFAPAALALTPDELKSAIDELCSSGLCRALSGGAYRAEAVATPEQVQHDLHLVEIIAHWLRMLAHADEVARDHRPSGYEVAGYDEACPACRLAWGTRPLAVASIPPFHPGCRCFAQPRFAID
ncbi:MAG TPA: hypothetical protein VMD47_10185 [Candidatus Acidoferrales bacterium]|nr:hypothetical protein [Candidatus Acidoferrales bacterium]